MKNEKTKTFYIVRVFFRIFLNTIQHEKKDNTQTKAGRVGLQCAIAPVCKIDEN